MSTNHATCKLGDPGIAELILGSSPPSTSYNQSGEGLPFYQGKVDFGLVSPKTRVWCRDGIQFADRGDVLVSVRAPVGDVNMATGRCVIGRGVAALRAGPRTDPWFLFFAMQHVQPVLMQRSSGSTFASVNKSTLQDLQIPCFEPEEQQGMARVLMHIVSGLEREGSAVTVGFGVKCAAMRDLFTRGLRGAPQKETENGLIPENWDVVRLGSLGRIGNGSTPKKGVREYWEGGTFPWLTSAKVYDRDIVAADAHVTPIALKECHLPVLKPGAVLVAITGQGKTLGHCAVLGIEATINQHLAYLQPDLEKTNPRYVAGYLETQYDYLRQVASGGGSTKGALTCAFLRDFPLPMPPTKDEQDEIAAVIDAIDRKIDLHRRKKAVLDELFKSMLHKLMTGEIRVADLDLSVLPAMPDVGEEARS